MEILLTLRKDLEESRIRVCCLYKQIHFVPLYSVSVATIH